MSNEDKKPTVRITLDAWQRILAYVDLVETEITGFARVEYEADKGSFLVDEVYLLKQDAQGTEVDMDADTISKFNYECIKMGMTQLPRLWWHSHADMRAFFSSTDDDTIENFATTGWMIALVVNKRREVQIDLMIFEPYPHRVPNLPVTIEYGITEIPDELRKEVEEKVNEVKSTPYVARGGDDKTHPKYKGKTEEGMPIFSLPSDYFDAVNFIETIGLEEQWDEDTQEFIYVNPNTGSIYYDDAGVLQGSLPIDAEEYPIGKKGGKN